MENNWAASLLHAAEPSLAPAGTRQVAPFWFSGASWRVDFPAVNGNSWESVTSPSVNSQACQHPIEYKNHKTFSHTSVSTTATGKQENLIPSCPPRVEVQAALSLGNTPPVSPMQNLQHGMGAKPLTKLLTTSIELAALLCFPTVIISNFSPALPSQALSCTGIRFCLKSPASGSTDRHCPPAVRSVADENARVAVASRTFAAAAACGLRTPPARATGSAWRVVFCLVYSGCTGVRGWPRADARVSLSKAGRAETRAVEPRRKAVSGAIMVAMNVDERTS